MPNGLVPQAPVHTDSLTVYKTGLRVIPTTEGEGTEIRRPVVTAEAVVEQRISHFIMALALIGTMTGPLLVVLRTMPTAVFAGVFFVVGVRQHLLPQMFTSSLTFLIVGFYRIEWYPSKVHLPPG